jgi:DNA-binding transcriptional MerR regulator
VIFLLKIDDIAKLTGLSKRSIRFYESKDLLNPKRSDANYRLYDEKDITRLFLIRFLKELDFPIESIKEILLSEQSNESILKTYVETLKKEVSRKKKIISEVKKIIHKEQMMTDKNAFNEFKKSLIEKNTIQYGREVEETYGQRVLNESNERFMSLSEKEYQSAHSLSKAINEMLKILVEDEISPSSEQGIILGKMHHQWLMYYWKSYSKEAHIGLANTYVEDERFAKYYEDIIKGGSEYMKEAVINYVNHSK